MSFLFKAIYCVQDSIIYLCATVTNAVKKSFACGGISALLFFNFTMFPLIFPAFQFHSISITYNSINYFCATVANAVKSFACGGLSSLLCFNFIMFQFIFSVFQFHEISSEGYILRSLFH